jgi:hypothetical protein
LTETSTDPDRGRGRPNRSERPERIPLADGEEAVRNDLVAKEHGTSERTVNRDDAKGAPYLYFGGVKYRPIKEYRAFLAGRIQRRGQAPQRRRAER